MGTFSVKQPNRAKLLTVAYTVLTQTEKGKPADETETNPLPSALWQRHTEGHPICSHHRSALLQADLPDGRQATPAHI